MDGPAHDRQLDAAAHQDVGPATKRQCILVLGMHRSGTSALTRVLSLLGAALPKHIMGAGPGNETGHWEPAPLVEYHDNLLAELDSSWDDWSALDLSRLTVQRRNEIKAEIAGLIAAEFGDAPLIVVKDPRICRFAQLFIEALGEHGIETRVVIAYRNPLEVVGSLAARTALWSADRSPVYGALLWLRHVLDAEATTRNVPRAIVSYDTLMRDWRQCMAQVLECLDTSWTYSLNDIADTATQFLSSGQRHHARSAEELLLDPTLHGWVGDAYSMLNILQRDPTHPDAAATLDQIRRELDRATPLFQQLLIDAGIALENLTAIASARKDEAQTLRANLDNTLLSLKQLQRNIETIEKSLSWRLARPLRLSHKLIKTRRTKKHRDLILSSGLFDADWYLQQHPDIKALGIDPALHYLQFGAVEGRQPSRQFDAFSYLAENTDVQLSGANPLVHYLLHGAAEGRSQSPELNTNSQTAEKVSNRDLLSNSPPEGQDSQTEKKAQNIHAKTNSRSIIKLRHIKKAAHALYLAPTNHTRVSYLVQSLHKYTTHWLDQNLSSTKTLDDAIARADTLRFVNNRRLNISISSREEPRINIILPTLDAAIVFGGYISLFHFSHFLQEIGFKLRIVVAEYLKNDLQSAIADCERLHPFVSRVLNSSLVVDCASTQDSSFRISSDDLFIAYNCNCARIAYNTIKDMDAGPHMFYIQEEEGHFHAHNSFRAHCESTYRLPYFGIYNSPQLMKYFEMMCIGNFSPDAACTKHISYRHSLASGTLPSVGDLAARNPRRLLFFGRPEPHAERNLFETGLNALSEACAEGLFPVGSWEIHAIGSAPFDPLPLPSGQKLIFVGKLPLEEYAKRLSEYDLGLSLMFAPHPSVPNLELAAAGVPTVTTSFINRDKAEMESISRNLIAVPPDVESLTAGLRLAKKCSLQFSQRLSNAEFDWPRTWDASFNTKFQDDFISALEATYGRERIGRLRTA